MKKRGEPSVLRVVNPVTKAFIFHINGTDKGYYENIKYYDLIYIDNDRF